MVLRVSLVGLEPSAPIRQISESPSRSLEMAISETSGVVSIASGLNVN